jgi:hypothetical protein
VLRSFLISSILRIDSPTRVLAVSLPLFIIHSADSELSICHYEARHALDLDSSWLCKQRCSPSPSPSAHKNEGQGDEQTGRYSEVEKEVEREGGRLLR